MKKKIFLSMIITVVVALLASSAVSAFVYYNFFEEQIKFDTKTQAEFIKAGYETAPDKETFLDGLPKGKEGLRLSVIEPDGNVCFDTYADANDLYDHLDRPEIAGAIKSGTGEAIRYSKTLKENSFYYAMMLSDGNIIRVAALTSTVGNVFYSMIPSILGLSILLLLICFALSKILTNRIVKPLEHLSDHLDELSEDDNYDELNPFVEKISKQNDTIQKQLQKSKEERDTITLITDNMQEGLVLMGENRYILSVNRSAISFLNRHSEMDFVGQNLVVLTREKLLLKAVDKALTGVSSDGVFQMVPPIKGTTQKRSYHYFVNPVLSKAKGDEGKINGVILLLLDVTSQQKAEKIRREFSANVSHELKTPLTTISGFSEMIENDMVESHEDLLRFAKIISKESGRLLSLIEDIMHLSKMDEGEKSIELEQVNTVAFVSEICERLMPKAEAKGVTIKKDLVQATIKSSRPMFQEIMYNLIDNAIKYNVENGSVTISSSLEDEKLSITVTDTGIGIDTAHHDRLFERFYRVDKSRSKQTGGTGLGLSIVKHAVELLGGDITLSSQLGKGTSIRVTFNC